MENRNQTQPPVTGKKWIHLGCSIALAFTLALILLFIPVVAGTTVRVSVPRLHFQSHSAAINIPLPFGVSLVGATGGLTITKFAPAEVDQGGILTYTLHITNDTGTELKNGFVADSFLSTDVDTSTCAEVPPPPPGWSFFCTSGGAAWQFGSIVTGATVEAIYKVKTAKPLTDGYAIVNKDYEISSNPLGSFSDNGFPVTTTVRAPMWAITKTVSSDMVQPNEFLTYTLFVTNVGHLETSGTYTITDILPANTIPSSADGKIQFPGTRSGITITWVLTESLSALGGTKTVTYSVKVDSPLAPGKEIVNNVYTVSGGGAFGSAISNSITSTIESSGTLNISKVAGPDPVQMSKTLIYTLTVTNDAGAAGPANNVVITDTLPGGVTFQSAGFVGATNGVTNTPTASTVVWQVTSPASLNPGASVQVTAAVTVDGALLPNPSIITNTYKASADNAAVVNGTPLGTQVQAGDPNAITVIHNAPSGLRVCESTMVTATVVDSWNNPVPDTSIQIQIDDVFPPAPPSSSAGKAVITPTSTFSSNTNGVVNAYVQGTEAGDVAVEAFVLPAGIIFDNTGIGNDIDFADPPVPTAITVTVSPSKVVTGATAVAQAQVGSCVGAVSGQVVTFTIPAAFGTVNPLTATTNAGGIATTTVTAGSTVGTTSVTGTTGALQDAASFTVEAVGTPELTVTKTANPAGGGTIASGGTISYTIQVTNTGSATATNVLLTDTLPLSVNYVSLVSSTTSTGGAISGPVINGNKVALSITLLEQDKTLVATMQVTVTAAISGASLTNLAKAKSSATDLVTSNVVAHTVITTTSSGNDVYLPIILKNQS